MKSDNRKGSINWVLVGLFALSLALYNQISYAEELRYKYLSLEEAQLPVGFTPGLNYFNHTTLGEDGKVYGTLFNIDFNGGFSAVYDNGVVTLIPGLGNNYFLPNTVNKKGLIGGIIEDFVASFSTAALIEKGKLIQLPGDWVCDINDSGTALVQGRPDFSIFKKEIETPVDFGPIVPMSIFNFFTGNSLCNVSFNNQETIAGSTTDPTSGKSRGFILAKGANQQPVLLKPKATETDSLAYDINNEGNVFGFSYIPSGIQRVGIWQKNAENWAFKTYFIQGTVKFPTISGLILANDKNQIVISNVTSPTTELNKSYIITEPGKRLDLDEITENIPSGQDLCFVDHINRNGDITGFSCGGDEFFLKRIVR
ncbi:MAG: hypothetical protein ABL884_01600 [Methyloglobulus sp.]